MYKIALYFLLSFTAAARSETILVFGGKTGWIGKKIVALIHELGHTAICAESRLENRQDIEAELSRINPDAIMNAAGITGKPNVDWCEDHKQETIRTNVLGTVTLADVAYMRGIHLTNISTGCIYEYDAEHLMWSGKGFTEKDEPNFTGSFYSRTKILMEKLILEYSNVLNLRVKMPISDDLEHGFVAKIIRYKKVINVPNSMTILDELLPIAVDMTLKRIKGNFNLVNPGTLSHNQVLDLYKKYIDPSFTYENFTIEEQDKILKARRANAELSAEKLCALYPDISSVFVALEKIFKNMKMNRLGEKV